MLKEILLIPQTGKHAMEKSSEVHTVAVVFVLAELIQWFVALWTSIHLCIL